MENYKKGKNIEQVVDENNLPIKLPSDCLWMRVLGGSKLRNLLSHALHKFPKQTQSLLWSGSGPSIAKTISCAEIVKKEVKNVHQITKICYIKVEEYWEPLVDDLDEIVVKRNIPTIYILLSINNLSSTEPGYQAPEENKYKSLENASKRCNIVQRQQELSKRPVKQVGEIDPKVRQKKQRNNILK